MCLYFLFRDRKQLFAPWKSPRNAIDLLIYGLAGVSACQFLYSLPSSTPLPVWPPSCWTCFR